MTLYKSGEANKRGGKKVDFFKGWGGRMAKHRLWEKENSKYSGESAPNGKNPRNLGGDRRIGRNWKRELYSSPKGKTKKGIRGLANSIET